MTAPTREIYAEVLSARIKTEVLDACTTCGKCAEACPMISPAGIQAESADLVKGVLAILAGEPASQESARWIEACSSSGTCISACAYGVDPMFMIEMARVSLLNGRGPKQVQANATRAFQGMAKSVRYLSRLFLEPDVFDRLSPKSGGRPDDQAPDVIFYTGCNVLRTPHIALICLDILDALDVQYEVMGGPSHCCGAYQIKQGDIGAASRMATNTIGKMVQAAAPEVISWCPSCQLQFGTNHLPTYTAASGGKSPFDFTPFYRFLERRIGDLAPRMQGRVEKTVMLDERAFDPAVNAAVRRILRLIPGLTIVEGHAKHVGMMRNMIPLQSVKNSSRNEAFDAATEAGVTTLATIYHACHREIVGYSDTVSFEIVNAIELIADCLGIAYHDSFKEFQLVSDIEGFIDERTDLISAHGLPLEELRAVARREREAYRPAIDQ